jgi:hypothetical protein
MPQEWFTDAGSGVEGPFTNRELQDLAASGQLRPVDRVSPDKVKWVRAEKVKGLSFASAGTKPKMPAMQETHVLPPQTTEPDLQEIPGYEVHGVLGRGACGVVFRARQLKLDRTVALKTVILNGPNARTAVARFEQEAVALAKLAHPHIVAVYDSGHHNGTVFFAMELLSGEDLLRRMGRGPLDERTAWSIARQTAAALAHAAHVGVYHRDIKPANLFLVKPPTGFVLPAGVPMVKVTDFGLALTTRSAEITPDSRLTAAGVVLGTPTYMAPEQFANSNVDHRADIYSLGATVYHALTDAPPFYGATVWELMLKKAEPAPRLGPEFSQESADLLEAMLAAKPAERIGSYEELIARIDALPCMTGAEPTRTTPALVEPPRGRKKWVYIAAALFGLAVAGVAVSLSGGGNQSVGKGTGAVTYVSSGFSEALFDGVSVKPWIGQGWGIHDDDGNPVVTGATSVRRPLPQPLRKHYRVQFGLNLHEATAVDVVAAVGEGPPDAATLWVLRIAPKTGAVFGKLVGGERGKFEPLGEAVPYPTAAELQGRVPYQNVRVEKAGDKIRVAYRERPAGEIPSDGLRLTELRLVIDGGAVRIESPTVEELVEKN